MPKKHPFGVTLFLWMVLFLSVWGILRLLATIRWWDVLSQYGAHLAPLYLAITGAVWAVAGVVLVWSIWAGKRWAYLAVPISIFLWLAEYWLERLFFEGQRANLAFMLIVTSVLSVGTLLITLNQKTKEFLLRSEEHEQPDQDSISA